MKVAIMSDSHDNWDNLAKAIAMANQEACELLLFAGDLISPPGVPILEKFNGQVKFVWGNNEGEKLNLTRKMDSSKKIKLCGDIFEGEIDGVKVFMNHYQRIVELAAKSGEFDFCVYGDTHDYASEKVGHCLLLNTGSIKGSSENGASFVVFDTTSKELQKLLIE